MGHDGVAMGEGVSYQIEVRYLQKRIYRSRFVALPCRPCAHRAQRRQDGRVGLYEETSPASSGPLGKFVAASPDFITDLLRAQNQTCGVGRDQPLPKAGQKSKP